LPFRSHYVSSDGVGAGDRSQWSASEHAIDKWIKRFGWAEMPRSEALRQILAAVETATQEREKGNGGALFYRCTEPPCRMVVRHQATGKRILTVYPPLVEVMSDEEGEFDDAA